MTVLFSVENRVVRITLNRPDRLNAVDAETEEALDAIWSDLERRDDISCVVVTGAGEKAFCAGADLKGGSGASGLEYWAQTRTNGFGGLAFRKTLDVPVIARVNGYALGVVSKWCLAAISSSQLRRPVSVCLRRGSDACLLTGYGAVTAQDPFNQAMGVMLTGRRFSAAEMQNFGIVNEIVPAAELDAAVDRWVAEIVACAPLSQGDQADGQPDRTSQCRGSTGTPHPGAYPGIAERGCAGRCRRFPRKACSCLAGPLTVLCHQH